MLDGIHISWEVFDDRIMALSKEERIPDRMRNLSKEERIEKLIKKFKETGSVLDKPRSRRPKTSDETKEAVEAKVSASPKKSLRRTSTVLGVPKPTIRKMLVEEKFHRYNLQILHHLNEDDPDRRM
ncbi:MTX3 protein [Octopus vulgaris]|uniref:MTX3 protein n=1 Tax=Octopus vulgaris TaxID=6645 RepID=A0AA36F1V8_OCTVU|nr:MTX3 protein [Octopus vulgaris]